MEKEKKSLAQLGAELEIDNPDAIENHKKTKDKNEEMKGEEDVHIKKSSGGSILSSKKSNNSDGDKRSYGNNGEIMFKLSSKKKVQIRKFKSMVLVDIREFWTNEGKELPTKKGISLTLDQWEALKELSTNIDKAIKEIE